MTNAEITCNSSKLIIVAPRENYSPPRCSITVRQFSRQQRSSSNNKKRSRFGHLRHEDSPNRLLISEAKIPDGSYRRAIASQSLQREYMLLKASALSRASFARYTRPPASIVILSQRLSTDK